jgi:lauroyl/myristoyl acyltransferase
MKGWGKLWWKNARKLLGEKTTNSNRRAKRHQFDPQQDDKIDSHDPRRFSIKELEGLSGLKMLALSNTMPFPLGARFYRRWLSLSRVQKRFHGHVQRALHPLFRICPPEEGDHAKALTANLMLTELRLWRLHFLETASDKQFAHWFPITGMEKLENALSSERGVILACAHHGEARGTTRWLARKGYACCSLEVKNLFKLLGFPETDLINVISLHGDNEQAALEEAQNELKEGKALVLAPDAYRGSSGVEMTFLGRRRHFTTTFASLAIGTDALVMPLSSVVDAEGRTHIHLHDPFDEGRVMKEEAERIHHYIEQYVRFLESLWTSHPGNVLVHHARTYFRLEESA